MTFYNYKRFQEKLNDCSPV
ncbi:hypothetical protein [Brevibacillus formosus]